MAILKEPYKYEFYNEFDQKEVFLDKNHSHFILVKNDAVNGARAEIDFREKFEESLSKKDSSDNSKLQNRWIKILYEI